MQHDRIGRAAGSFGRVALALAALMAVASACGDDGDSILTSGRQTDESEHGTLVEGEGWRGVLLDGRLDSIQPDGAGSSVEATSFVPSEDDARRFEEQLPEVDSLDAGWDQDEPVDWSVYVRQYTGVEGAGERHLRVHGSCDRPEGWERSWMQVDDGGTCYWYATMDLATGEIFRFRFNGEA